MCTTYVLKDSLPFSGNLPNSGMMLNGTLYQLMPLDFPTLGSVSGLLPTITATEWKGAPHSRYKGSEKFRGGRLSEGLRISSEDFLYTNPNFAEVFMGYPMEWTALEV